MGFPNESGDVVGNMDLAVKTSFFTTQAILVSDQGNSPRMEAVEYNTGRSVRHLWLLHKQVLYLGIALPSKCSTVVLRLLPSGGRQIEHCGHVHRKR